MVVCLWVKTEKGVFVFCVYGGVCVQLCAEQLRGIVLKFKTLVLKVTMHTICGIVLVLHRYLYRFALLNKQWTSCQKEMLQVLLQISVLK